MQDNLTQALGVWVSNEGDIKRITMYIMDKTFHHGLANKIVNFALEIVKGRGRRRLECNSWRCCSQQTGETEKRKVFVGQAMAARKVILWTI